LAVCKEQDSTLGPDRYY